MTNIVRQHAWNACFAIGFGLVLPFAALAENAPLVVTKIDGTQLSGKLVAWNAKQITLQTAEGAVIIASSEMLRAQWRRASSVETKAETFVELSDGTRLPHQAYEVQENQAFITTSLAEQPIKLATDRVEFVQLLPDAPERDEMEQELDGDKLVVRKKQTGAIDYLTGIIGDVSAAQVNFTWDGESIPVNRSKVAALIYYHAKKPLAKAPVCWLRLLDGSRLPVLEIAFDAPAVDLRTNGGLAFSLSLDSIRDADFSPGKQVYLSDLKPIEQRWTPRIGLPKSAELIRQHGLPRRDLSFTGSALALSWPASKIGALDGELRTYEKGLALRSRTNIRYRIPKGMKRFAAIAGIDPETSKQGNVTLEIFADRQSIWQSEIEGESAPRVINVALGDARELRLVVDYGKNLDFGDRLHLAEARLSR